MLPSSSAIGALIFDYGGVLMRTHSQEPRRQLAARLGLSPQELYNTVFAHEAVQRAELGVLSSEECGRQIGQALGLNSREEVHAFWREFFAGDVLDTVLVEHIRRWHRRFKTALLSNFTESLPEYVRNDLGLGDCFNEIIVSASAGIRKPDPAIYELVLERLRVAPHQAIFVDDMPVNVQGAQSVGMHGILFTSREALLEELRNLLGDELATEGAAP